MRTIKPPSEAPVYHLTCNNRECNAVMECKKEELRHQSDQRDGDSYVLTCPHCKSESWFADIRKYAVYSKCAAGT